MRHKSGHDTGGEGILAKKGMWIGIGAGVFILIGFILPTPESILHVLRDHGFADKMIEWEVAHDLAGAGRKTMMVLGMIPMAIIFFATEAMPIEVLMV